jgi:hypothetical protein
LGALLADFEPVEDHSDDTNLVVDELGNGELRVRAIDFEHPFRWTEGEQSVLDWAPPGLVSFTCGRALGAY